MANPRSLQGDQHNQGGTMKNESELDVNLIVASLREQIGVLALDKAILSARIAELESKNDTIA